MYATIFEKTIAVTRKLLEQGLKEPQLSDKKLHYLEKALAEVEESGVALPKAGVAMPHIIPPQSHHYHLLQTLQVKIKGSITQHTLCTEAILGNNQERTMKVIMHS